MMNYSIKSYRLLKKYRIISLLNIYHILKSEGIKGVKEKLELKRYKPLLLNNPYFKKKVIVVIDKNCCISKVKRLLTKNEDYLLYKICTHKTKGNDFNVKHITYEEFYKLFRYKSFIFISKHQVKLEAFYFAENVILCDDLEKIISDIIHSKFGLKLFANYENENAISVKTSTFYDNKGYNYYSGGGRKISNRSA